MKFYRNGVEWENGSFYFYWWNLLPKDHRYIGPYHIWHDGPHYTFGFWFTNISWSFYYSNYREEEMFVRPWIDDWHWMDKKK